MNALCGIFEVIKSDLQIWIPSIVSIITFLLTGCFYLFVQPRLTYKSKAKETLKKASVQLLNYLAEIVSYDDFAGVPTKVRKYSLQIHLCFKKGTANGLLELKLEQVYMAVNSRKSLNKDVEIENWNDSFRVLVRELRIELARYCGAF